MSDLSEKPPSTKYSGAFEAAWAVHRVGNKLAAWRAGVKREWTPANWTWLGRYLEQRNKDDYLWLTGKVHHMSTIINQEKWEENYRKIGNGRQTESPQYVETHQEAMVKIDIANQQRLH